MTKNPESTKETAGVGKRGIWALHRKILLTITCLLLLLGLTSVLITRTILLKVLKTEFKNKAVAQARGLAANSALDVLTQNSLRLKKLMENEKILDPSIAYAFIQDSTGRLLGHTFEKGFPVELGKANNLKDGRPFNIQTLDTELGLIYDIDVPIFSGKSFLGEARVGILQESIQKTINVINLVFIGATLLIMAIGIPFAYKISSLITAPIRKLVCATELVTKGNLSTRIDVKTNDEIGILASSFNEMTSHLRTMVQEMKRLTAIEERNKIAMDLHDGCAQDFASILKRLELIEKIFQIEPSRAFKEMLDLKEDTKGALQRTRRVISELKSSEEVEYFNLLDKLTSYIEEYERTNDIRVRLEVSPLVNDISSIRKNAIFYIVREIFTNVKKHSHAKNVEVSVNLNGGSFLRIQAKDNGRGFDFNEKKLFGWDSGKWGLLGMRERTTSLGGTFLINSKPNEGTEISIDIPLIERLGTSSQSSNS